MEIKSIFAREVLDSRGNPTVEVEIEVEGFVSIGGKGQAHKKEKVRAIAPSGASTGVHEAHELRDGGKRFLGKGVLRAVENVNKIIGPAIIGKYNNMIPSKPDLRNEDELMIDLDGTENKSKLGANAMIATSIAMVNVKALIMGKEVWESVFDKFFHPGLPHLSGEFINPSPTVLDSKEFRQRLEKETKQVQEEFDKGRKKYLEKRKNLKMPIPFLNIINGGKHAGGDLQIQEFMIVPKLKNFKENLQASSEVYHTLKKLLSKKYGNLAVNVGDEGGFAPPISTPNQAMDIILEAVEEVGYEGKIKLAIDAAASEFLTQKKTNSPDDVYDFYNVEPEKTLDPMELVDYYMELVKSYPLMSIEDPFQEEDFFAFSELTKKAKGKAQVVGDDLLVTNPKRIERGIKESACNSLLLKVNQIGTVSEAITAAKMCKKKDWSIVVSHRSGETEDTFISNFAVGIQAEYIKTGAPARGERTAKYNQLLRIEELLHSN